MSIRSHLSATSRIVATLSLLVCIAFASTSPIGGNDFWLQAKVGEWILQHRDIPRTLLFQFTEASQFPFHAHEWLASVFLYGVLQALGELWTPWLTGLMGLMLFALNVRLAQSGAPQRFILPLIAAYVAMAVENYRHVLRPELPAMLCMGVFWNLLEYFQLRPRKHLALGMVTITVLWANLHGSFVLAPALVAMYAGGNYLERLRSALPNRFAQDKSDYYYGTLGLLVSLACLLTPFGIELPKFVLTFSLHQDPQHYLTEWIPTLDRRLWSLRGFWIALSVWLTLTAILLAQRKHLRIVDGLIYLFFTALAVQAIRFPVYLSFVFALLVPKCLPRSWLDRLESRCGVLIVCLLSAATLWACAMFGNAAERLPYLYDDPTKLTEHMVQTLADPDLHGNVLNTMELGAELTYRTYPRMRPSIDSRFDSYGAAYNDANQKLFKDDVLLKAFVARYDVRYILMDGSQYDIFTHLPSWKQGEWRLYFSDHRAALFQRSDLHEGKLQP